MHNFFKPDNKKYLILIILIFLILATHYLRTVAYVIHSCEALECNNVWTDAFGVMLGFLALPLLFTGNLGVEPEIIGTIILLIFEAGYLYVLSCMFAILFKEKDEPIPETMIYGAGKPKDDLTPPKL